MKNLDALDIQAGRVYYMKHRTYGYFIITKSTLKTDHTLKFCDLFISRKGDDGKNHNWSTAPWRLTKMFSGIQEVSKEANPEYWL